MKESRIASRYAKALFQLAQEQHILKNIVDDMKLVKQVVVENREFRVMLSNPIVKADKKVAIFNQVFGQYLHHVSMSFLGIIIKKNREIIAEAIADSFISQYNEYAGIKKVQLKTAVAIDETMKEKIVEAVKQGNKIDVELFDTVDESLMGGFVLSFDNKQYDASIKSRLQRLAKTFSV